MEDKKRIPFRIIGIDTRKFKVKEEVGPDIDKAKIRSTFSFAVNATRKLVRCDSEYTYNCQGEDVLVFAMSCVFALEDEGFSQMTADGKFTIEPYFSQYLATISVGAARGEIHARCEAEHSPLAKLILPPMNLVKALPDPIVIDL